MNNNNLADYPQNHWLSNCIGRRITFAGVHPRKGAGQSWLCRPNAPISLHPSAFSSLRAVGKLAQHRYLEWCPVISTDLACEFWTGETLFLRLLLALLLLMTFPACERWLCSPCKETQVFLKTQQESLQLRAKAGVYAGPDCPAQTMCVAGALPFSRAELTCAARLKDKLGHGEDLRKTDCCFQNNAPCDKQRWLLRSGGKLLRGWPAQTQGFFINICTTEKAGGFSFAVPDS